MEQESSLLFTRTEEYNKWTKDLEKMQGNHEVPLLYKDILREYQVEIKTVNHKYIDINIKMPRIISYLEEDVRKLITSKIKRGK